MNLTKYSSKNIESQLEHVCELIDLVKGDRGLFARIGMAPNSKP